MANGIYEGGLWCDGNGNLLAYCPENDDVHGLPVAYHEGSYVFIGAHDPSHNDRHHKQFAHLTGTQSVDPEAPGYVEQGAEENQHHFGILEDDPHYDPEAPNNTRVRHLPDKIAKTATGHTDAYKGGGV